MNLITDILTKANIDTDFRTRLLRDPKNAIKADFGLNFPEGFAIEVHEETDQITHLVLPPKDKMSVAERTEAKTGATSLEFLKRTMSDPAPPKRPAEPNRIFTNLRRLDPVVLATAGRESIIRGLHFLRGTVAQSGAWHCIRFNVADPDVPRHYERPPFISAFCVLALSRSKESVARALCTQTQHYLVDTMEYPGFWRYYRHLPQDLDSSSLCSLVLDTHPWIGLGRNIPPMLANRDDQGCFKTWVLNENEPSVVAPFRIEADPVVNANVIAYLGDLAETKKAQSWLTELICDGTKLTGLSKWYPDLASMFYAIARSLVRVPFGPKELSSVLADKILSLTDDDETFDNVLQAAQAVVALHNIGQLNRLDVPRQIEYFVNSQQADGSWPELLAFGDQSRRWGVVGEIGHGSESVTTAFTVEAQECLLDALEFS